MCRWVHMCGRGVGKLREGNYYLQGISRIAMYWYKVPGSQRVYNRRRVQALSLPSTVDSFEHVCPQRDVVGDT
jgi:hypothetical protein